jgi:light-regulated signal transduction histidine kinase (bacteriophytochrome)
MPHMPVPLPRMCSILAHELRSPLSVLQGYIRLLQRQRDPAHPDVPMLDAMLEATGRLTVIARQASDLGNWLTGQQSRPFDDVPVSAITDAIANRLDQESRAIVMGAAPAAAGDVTLRADPSAAVDAILALAVSMHRDDESATIEIRVSDPIEGGSVDVSLHALTPPRERVSSSTGALPRRPLSFDRGGAGLALVAASYVLDAHGVSVDSADDPARIVLRFPRSGGSQ